MGFKNWILALRVFVNEEVTRLFEHKGRIVMEVKEDEETRNAYKNFISKLEQEEISKTWGVRWRADFFFL